MVLGAEVGVVGRGVCWGCYFQVVLCFEFLCFLGCDSMVHFWVLWCLPFGLGCVRGLI